MSEVGGWYSAGERERERGKKDFFSERKENTTGTRMKMMEISPFKQNILKQ